MPKVSEGKVEEGRKFRAAAANKAPGGVNSPCVRNCCLDQLDYCLGCFRHLEEITGWAGFSDEKKRQVLEQCRLRKVNRRP